MAMNDLDTREWLITNGLGSFASGTVCDARTRTYHGWLIAALEPPGSRTLFLSHLDASLELAGKIRTLSTNFWDGGNKIEPRGYRLLQSFSIKPVPTWIWSQPNWQLTRQLLMPYGLAENEEDSKTAPLWSNRLLIRYQYQGDEVATLRLRLLIGDRDFHHQQSEKEGLQFSQLVGSRQIYLQGIRDSQAGMPWQFRWSRGDYQPEGVWYWNYYHLEEKKRGLGDREDLYSPGYLSVTLQPGEAVTLEARVGWPSSALPELNTQSFDEEVQREQERQKKLFALAVLTPGNEASNLSKDGDYQNSNSSLGKGSPQTVTEREQLWHQLLRAGDQFVTYRASIKGPTVIAGYHWFNDWGRDTLIALPGLALATKRFALAKGLLKTFGSYCRNGLIPNTFPDAGAEPIYNSIDASLWWIEVLGLYLETSQDWDFLIEQYPVVRKIYKGLTVGTLYNIGVDATDGLLIWDAPQVALTWMDAVVDGRPITPRRGKPIEINALWYSALCWISKWTEKLVQDGAAERVNLLHHGQHYAQQADKVKASLQKFWHPELNYFHDTIKPDDQADGRIRPNAIIALSLHHCGFPTEQARRVLQVACDRLLTPYGLRSLDPADPDYMGYYQGDRLHRDQAYHQGTVWSWLIGPFIRAWKRFYTAEPLTWDSRLLLTHFLKDGCIGSISEIFDGNAPHLPQGAIAQAWSVAELIRHFDDF